MASTPAQSRDTLYPGGTFLDPVSLNAGGTEAQLSTDANGRLIVKSGTVESFRTSAGGIHLRQGLNAGQDHQAVITFSHGGSSNYSHEIISRHHAGQAQEQENQLAFRLWGYDSVGGVAAARPLIEAFKITGLGIETPGRIGMGSGKKLHLRGVADPNWYVTADGATLDVAAANAPIRLTSGYGPSSPTLVAFTGTQNVTIGGNSDAGYRLDVQGTLRATDSIALGTVSNIHMGWGRRISWSATGLAYNAAAQIGANSDGTLRIHSTAALHLQETGGVLVAGSGGALSVRSGGAVNIGFNGDVNWLGYVPKLYVSGAGTSLFDGEVRAATFYESGALVKDTYLRYDTMISGPQTPAAIRLIHTDNDNVLWDADRRLTVTTTGGNGAGQTWVRTYDLVTKGAFPANGLVYPSGKVFVTFWSGQEADIALSSVRFKTQSGTWWGPYPFTVTRSAEASFKHWVAPAPGTNYVTHVEFTLVGRSDAGFGVQRMAYIPGLPNSVSDTNVLLAEQDNTVYRSWQWKGSDGLQRVIIDPTANNYGSYSIKTARGTGILIGDDGTSQGASGILRFESQGLANQQTADIRLDGYGAAGGQALDIIFSNMTGGGIRFLPNSSFQARSWYFNNAATAAPMVAAWNNSAYGFDLQNGYPQTSGTLFRVLNNTATPFQITAATGNVQIGTTTDSGFKLEAAGDVKFRSKILLTSPTAHVNLDFVETTMDPQVYMFRDNTSGGVGYGYTMINIGSYGYQNKHKLQIGAEVRSNIQLVVNQDYANPTLGLSSGAFRIIRNQGSGNFAFGIDLSDRAYIQNNFSGVGKGLMLNPLGGDVHVGAVPASSAGEKLSVAGALRASGFFINRVTDGTAMGLLTVGSDNTVSFGGNSTGQALSIAPLTGNVLINTVTDAGFKFDVVGKGRIRTATTAGEILHLGDAGFGNLFVVESLAGVFNGGERHVRMRTGANAGGAIEFGMSGNGGIRLYANMNLNKVAFEASHDGGTTIYGTQGTSNPAYSRIALVGQTQDFFTDNVVRMRIGGGGRVLIGTTDDSGDLKLRVAGNVVVEGMLNLNGDFGGWRAGLSFYNHFLYADARDGHIWQIGTAERMRFTATGLKIGAGDPAYKLDVDGTLRASGTSLLQGLVSVQSHVYPTASYASDLGSGVLKFRTLNAAELVVATLVSQDEVITTGGRQMVGVSTVLVADAVAAAAVITVKHNNLVVGHRIHLESRGQVEWMVVTSGPTTVTGGFQYGVQRNHDGTGANNWIAGDGVHNTGTIGTGFIDNYALTSVLGGMTAGPATAYMVRTGLAHSDVEPRALAGSLTGFYGYGTGVFGFVAGSYAGSWISVDDTNGLRFMSGGTELGYVRSGTLKIGSLIVTPTTTTIAGFTASATEFTGGQLKITSTGTITSGTGAAGSSTMAFALLANGSFTLRNYLVAGAAGMIIGPETVSNVFVGSTGFILRWATEVRASLDVDALNFYDHNGDLAARFGRYGTQLFDVYGTERLRVNEEAVLLYDFNADERVRVDEEGVRVGRTGTQDPYLRVLNDQVAIYGVGPIPGVGIPGLLEKKVQVLDSGVIIGSTDPDRSNVFIQHTGFDVRTGGTSDVSVTASGIRVGRLSNGASAAPNVWITPTQLILRRGTGAPVFLADADGSGHLANTSIRWNTAGHFFIDNQATIGGWSISAEGLSSGQLFIKPGIGIYHGSGAAWNDAGTPFYIGADGSFSLGESFAYSQSSGLYLEGNGIFTGIIQATAGVFSDHDVVVGNLNGYMTTADFAGFYIDDNNRWALGYGPGTGGMIEFVVGGPQGIQYYSENAYVGLGSSVEVEGAVRVSGSLSVGQAPIGYDQIGGFFGSVGGVFKSSWKASATEYLRFTGTAVDLATANFDLHSAGIKLNGLRIALGGATALNAGVGLWAGANGEFRVGTALGNRLQVSAAGEITIVAPNAQITGQTGWLGAPAVLSWSATALTLAGWSAASYKIERMTATGSLRIMSDSSVEYGGTAATAVPSIIAFTEPQGALASFGRVFDGGGMTNRFGIAFSPSYAVGGTDFEVSKDLVTGALVRRIAGWNFTSTAFWKGADNATGASVWMSTATDATNSTGNNEFYSGRRLEGFGMRWLQSSNAGWIVMGQMTETVQTVKAGFYGIQMMDYQNREYFAMGANVTTTGYNNVYNRIAGWEFTNTAILRRSGTGNSLGTEIYVSSETDASSPYDGSGVFYAGRKLQGFGIKWHEGGNAGHLVMGQMASSVGVVKTGFFGIQMMDHVNREMFALGARVSGGYETYNRIAGFSFDSQRLHAPNNTVILGNDLGGLDTQGRILIGNFTNGGVPVVRVSGGSGNYTQLLYSTGTQWGLEGYSGGVPVFQLGSTNQIAGWTFGLDTLSKGTGADRIVLDSLNRRFTIGGEGNYAAMTSGIFLGVETGISKFRLGTALTFNGSLLALTGTINATGGTFTGDINVTTGRIIANNGAVVLENEGVTFDTQNTASFLDGIRWKSTWNSVAKVWGRLGPIGYRIASGEYIPNFGFTAKLGARFTFQSEVVFLESNPGGGGNSGGVRMLTDVFINQQGITDASPGQVYDSAVNRTVRIRVGNANRASFEAIGSDPAVGYGQFYAGGNVERGGGFEFTGSAVASSGQAGAGYNALFRRTGGGNAWTARNLHSNNDWEFRGQLIWADTSDATLKDVQGEIDGLAVVRSIRGVQYVWKTDADAAVHEGVLAQEVREVLPSAVTVREDGTLAVKHLPLIGGLFAGLRGVLGYAETEVKKLRRENAGLKKRMASIEERLSALETA